MSIYIPSGNRRKDNVLVYICTASDNRRAESLSIDKASNKLTAITDGGRKLSIYVYSANDNRLCS